MPQASKTVVRRGVPERPALIRLPATALVYPVGEPQFSRLAAQELGFYGTERDGWDSLFNGVKSQLPHDLAIVDTLAGDLAAAAFVPGHVQAGVITPFGNSITAALRSVETFEQQTEYDIANSTPWVVHKLGKLPCRKLVPIPGAKHPQIPTALEPGRVGSHPTPAPPNPSPFPPPPPGYEWVPCVPKAVTKPGAPPQRVGPGDSNIPVRRAQPPVIAQSPEKPAPPPPPPPRPAPGAGTVHGAPFVATPGTEQLAPWPAGEYVYAEAQPIAPIEPGPPVYFDTPDDEQLPAPNIPPPLAPPKTLRVQYTADGPVVVVEDLIAALEAWRRKD